MTIETRTSSLTILTNSFHQSEYRTRKTRDELDAIESAAPWNQSDSDKAFVRKVRDKLCGIKGCTCGQNSYGERQQLAITS